VIDLHEVAAEYVAVPVVAPTPANVIVARGRQLRARRRRRLVATLVLIAAVPTLAIATMRSNESSVHVIAPSPAPSTSTHAVTTVNPCKYPGGRVQPVPGFDPFTASDSEIKAQDFPPRPRPGEPGYERDLAAWRQYVTWYLTGQVYRCLAGPGTQQNSGVFLGPAPTTKSK
jgi:hypothetical protein